MEEPMQTWGSGEAPSGAARDGDTVLVRGGPWALSVLALLRHFEDVGFAGAPRVVGDGISPDGRMVLSHVVGESAHPHLWPDEEAAHDVGALLRAAHDAARDFDDEGLTWQPHWLRELGSHDEIVIGHGDAAPWNIVGPGGRPAVLLDWESAGPVDSLSDLAYCAWTNAQLHDDDVAEAVGLPDAETRTGHLHALLDGYGLATGDTEELVDRMVQVALEAARFEAVFAGVGQESTQAVTPEGNPVLWAIAWRARAAAWMLRNRRLLVSRHG